MCIKKHVSLIKVHCISSQQIIYKVPSYPAANINLLYRANVNMLTETKCASSTKVTHLLVYSAFVSNPRRGSWAYICNCDRKIENPN